MPPATVPLSAAQRITRRVLTLLIVGVLVAACGLSFLRLRHIDPRGRAAWSGAPLVFSGSPREFTVWLPACDVRAIILHPGPGSTGHLAIDYFRRTLGPRGEPRTTGASGTTIRVSGSRPVRLRMDDGVAAGWREALTLSVRLEDGFGGPPPVGSSVALEPRRPITLEMFDHAWFGNLACAFDAGSDARTWTVVIATVVVMGGIGLLAAAWGSRARAPATAWTLDLLAAGRLPLVALLVGATTVTYALVVPPFEPPDELAHLQYARYVATTGGLPRDVPSPDSEWRASSYEWVQQPLYYLGAAAVLRATGLHAAAPQLRLNARSRLQAQGTEPTIYQHAEPTGDRTGHRALALLRAVSALMAVATAWLVARLAFRVTDDPVVVTTVAGGLALIPQWCAVMGAVSTDPPATLLAAAATLAVVRLALERITPARLLTTGLLIGAAYAVKATAAFLVPMAGAACLIATFTPVTPLLTTPRSTRWRTLAIRLVWIGVGIVLVAGWIPLRAWLLYGDPQAFEFKRRILEAGGFVPTPGPMPWTAEFWALMRVMVFEPFWARFGSLGAGPLPGSRIWAVYAAASVLVLALGCRAAASSAWVVVSRERWDGLGPTARARVCVVTLSTVGVALGLAGWCAVNLMPRADMVVHWTPRHILPLTAPAAVLVAAGLHEVRVRGGWQARAVAVTSALTLVGLALAYLSVLRAALLTLHFGY